MMIKDHASTTNGCKVNAINFVQFLLHEPFLFPFCSCPLLHGLTFFLSMPFPFLSLFLYFSLHFHATAAVQASVEYVYPNFSATNLFYFDTNGVFLTSVSGAFQATIYKPGTQQINYYFSVVHGPSGTVVWTANRDMPIDRTSTVELTAQGLYANYPNGTALWSTPPLKAPVKSLHLLENGNLVIEDAQNASLWQSFDHPTDALLSGQHLSVGTYLASSNSDTDYAESDYRLDVTASDAILGWLGIPYWRMSNDMNSIKDRDATVAYLTMDDSGVSLTTSSGASVFQISLQPAPLRILKLGSDGRLLITSYATANSSVPLSNAFEAPSSSCDLPLSCGSLSICSGQGNSSSCLCPPNFASSTHSSGCSPVNGNIFAANSSCNGKDNPGISYLSVGSGITYFGNKFRSATAIGKNGSDCETLCTNNCTCSGYFYDTSSKSCFFLQQPIGSLINANSTEAGENLGYVKIVNSNDGSGQTDSSSSPRILPIVLPSIAALLAMLVICGFGFVWWRKNQKKVRNSKSSLTKIMIHGPPSRPVSDSDCLFSDNDDDISEILLPGLPNRFSFEELEEITGNFRTKIGSGGFGSVYKGELVDGSTVAVKKIEGVGLQGRKEFCTEIAVIGNIHHVNLVRLRGYCAQGSHRLLVYEYMNCGSLDRSLFRPTGPLLEWKERMHVAIGAARGLAYLHSGCQPKILHCDVKPENILLDDGGKKTQVKIADFGLAKLLTPEQSGLFTTMRGTRGYLAPEWLSNTPISDRTDVYSFGMVLLELIHGKKNRSERVTDSDSVYSSASTESGSCKSEYFPLTALEMHERNNYADLADPRLEGRVELHELERMVKTALCCLHEDPGLRPSMTSVAAMLEGTMEVWEPRAEALGFLRVYGRGFARNPMEIDDMSRFARSRTTTATNSEWPSYMSSNQLSGPR